MTSRPRPKRTPDQHADDLVKLLDRLMAKPVPMLDLLSEHKHKLSRIACAVIRERLLRVAETARRYAIAFDDSELPGGSSPPGVR